jgi:hypothetical protein
VAVRYAKERRWGFVYPLRAAYSKGDKINVISEKDWCAINFKLSSHKQGNAINSLIVMFLRLVISFMGSHCDYWPRVPKKLATPLLVVAVMSLRIP